MIELQAEREQAAKWIEENGWRQGVGTDPRDGLCLIVVLVKLNLPISVDDALRSDLAALEVPPISLPLWNDAPGRTKDQVLKLLRGTLTREDL
jgi:hypothetical protein